MQTTAYEGVGYLVDEVEGGLAQDRARGRGGFFLSIRNNNLNWILG